jgi:hypothetical protein
LFPVLEYKAPQALYIGAVSALLDHYDERTHQQLLAPPDKLAVLGALPLENVQTVFNPASTDNKELWGCVFGSIASTNVPCAFQTPMPVPAPVASGTVLDLAEKAFSAGNLSEAKRLVTLVLNQQPDNSMAGYVSRVIERAQKAQKPDDRTQAMR